MTKNVCIFCGANTGNSENILRQIEKLMDLLIKHDFDLVYGGGKYGLMGVIANKFLSHGRKVTGIRPKKLIIDEEAEEDITKLIIVEDMFERKAKMIENADVFIALPGGVGTLDEIIEVFTQVKIGFIDKLCLVLDVDNYYEGLDILLKRMVKDSFLKEKDRKILHIVDSPEELMDVILNGIK